LLIYERDPAKVTSTKLRRVFLEGACNCSVRSSAAGGFPVPTTAIAILLYQGATNARRDLHETGQPETTCSSIRRDTSEWQT